MGYAGTSCASDSRPPEVLTVCLDGWEDLEGIVRAMGAAWQENISSIEQLERERAEVVEMKKCVQQLIVQGALLLQRGGGQRNGCAKDTAGTRRHIMLRIGIELLKAVALVGAADRVLTRLRCSSSTTRKVASLGKCR